MGSHFGNSDENRLPSLRKDGERLPVAPTAGAAGAAAGRRLLAVIRHGVPPWLCEALAQSRPLFLVQDLDAVAPRSDICIDAKGELLQQK